MTNADKGIDPASDPVGISNPDAVLKVWPAAAGLVALLTLGLFLAESFSAARRASLGGSLQRPTAGSSSSSRQPTTPSATPPREYSKKEFDRALRAKLTAEEAGLVVNPLASTPEMDNWARRQTRTATTELASARLLYEALMRRVTANPVGSVSQRSAAEAFDSLIRTGSYSRCEDVAYLYVALARAVGLRAYFVCVEEDCRAIQVVHACAVVFIDGDALMVDPAYARFGVPHQKVVVTDDLGAAAVYLSASRDVRRCRIANKLAPHLTPVQISLFSALMRERLWEEAGQQATAMMSLQPEGHMTYCAAAAIAAQNHDPRKAMQLARRGFLRAPENSLLLAMLGSLYLGQEKWAEGRHYFESAMRYEPTEAGAEADRRAIVFADLHICRQNLDWDGTITNADKLIAWRIELPDAYAGRAKANRYNGDLNGALSDYSAAIEQAPYVPWLYYYRGSVHYARRELAEALTDFRKAAALEPTNYLAYCRAWLAHARLRGQADGTALQHLLSQAKKDAGDNWPLPIARFLLGEVTEPQLLDSAATADQEQNANQHCEAYFYAGSKRLLLGDRAGALALLQKSVATGVRTNAEHLSALEELRIVSEDELRRAK